MTTSPAPNFKALFRSLDFDHPLNVEDEKDAALYVPDMHVSNGFSSPLDELCGSIDMSDRPGTWLFTGHRGVGKSTELRRLARDLRQKGHLVVVADMENYLNLAEPIDTVTLLITLAGALAKGCEGEEQLGKVSGLQESWSKRFYNYLTKTEVNIKEFGIDAEVFSAQVELKEKPAFRQKIVQAMEGSIGTFAEEVRQFIKPIAEAWKHKQGNDEARVILILDSLERLRASGANAEVCYQSIRNTFDINAAHLKMEHIDVVYSVPPYLPFLIPNLGSYFGVDVCTLPHVKVFETPKNGVDEPPIPCDKGVNLMVETVLRRYPAVEQLIPREGLVRLALASSGGMRNYFRLLRSVCTKANVGNVTIPLHDQRLLDAAEQNLRNEMPLAEDDKEWLRIVRKTHGTGLKNIDKLHELARLFDSEVILNYRNGHDWCDVHYLLQADLAEK